MIKMIKKLIMIPATVTPISLLLPVRTGTGGRRNPFIVQLANQQICALRDLASLREIHQYA
jgi:hypothetical protein